ncbi:MAG TPA: plastocyanin/azurin family copper-binding protein [Candidatus Limnocylindrales bacterium]|nr:plastocyanin/azurin family copper-binding protein [Candidatus Limnocylindrales bacterium]
MTIRAGETVAFTNQDSVVHTITEGTLSKAARNACVDQRIVAGGTWKVTFNEPGDYQITCTLHPMQTAVHVQ